MNVFESDKHTLFLSRAVDAPLPARMRNRRERALFYRDKRTLFPSRAVDTPLSARIMRIAG